MKVVNPSLKEKLILQRDFEINKQIEIKDQILNADQKSLITKLRTVLYESKYKNQKRDHLINAL